MDTTFCKKKYESGLFLDDLLKKNLLMGKMNRWGTIFLKCSLGNVFKKMGLSMGVLQNWVQKVGT